MRKILIAIGLAAIFILATFTFMQSARGQVLPDQNHEIIITSETQDGNTRQISAPESNQTGGDEANQPLIGFIESPTAGCVQPDPTKDECFINWYYMSVDAAPSYMITMTVMINDFGFVSRYSGFFQSSMYVPYSMNPQGYKVACGSLGDGGNPSWGEVYNWTIRARDSAGLSSANYGSVYCPAFTP
jgi:hypothetical protein